MKFLKATIFCLAVGSFGLTACDDDDTKPTPVDAGGTDAPVNADTGTPGTGGSPGTTDTAVDNDTGGSDAAPDGGTSTDDKTVHLSIINAPTDPAVTPLDVTGTAPPELAACQ